MTFRYDFEWPDNKYSRRYLRLIELCEQGRWVGYKGYTERHHVVPKSFGGSNARSNIAVLPGKFHYHAHYWLMKAFPAQSKPGRSMIAAFRKMNLARAYQHRPQKGVLYEEMRLLAKQAGSGRKMSESNKAKLIASRVGIPRSVETRRKISEAHTGKKLTDEHRAAIGNSQRGRLDTDDTKERRAAHHRGKTRSEEARANMREGRRRAKERRETEHQTFTPVSAIPSTPKTDL